MKYTITKNILRTANKNILIGMADELVFLNHLIFEYPINWDNVMGNSRKLMVELKLKNKLQLIDFCYELNAYIEEHIFNSIKETDKNINENLLEEFMKDIQGYLQEQINKYREDRYFSEELDVIPDKYDHVESNILVRWGKYKLSHEKLDLFD
jgi:hypothetical protein